MFLCIRQCKEVPIKELREKYQLRSNPDRRSDILFQTLKIMEILGITKYYDNKIIKINERVQTDNARLELLWHIRHHNDPGVKYVAEIINYYVCPPSLREIETDLTVVFRRFRGEYLFYGDVLPTHELKIDYLMKILRFVGVGIVRGSRERPRVLPALAPSLLEDIYQERIYKSKKINQLPVHVFLGLIDQYIRVYHENSPSQVVLTTLFTLEKYNRIRLLNLADGGPIFNFKNKIFNFIIWEEKR